MNLKDKKYKLVSFLIFCFLYGSLASVLNAQSLNLLPDIPEPSTNPHLATAFNGVNPGVTTWPPANYFKDADELLVATMAYLHPSSPYKDNQAYLDRALFILDKVLGGWNDGSMALNEMTFCLHAPVSYYMLKQYKPSAISKLQQTNWEAGIRKNITAIINAAPEMYSDNIVGALWINGDIRLACCVYFGSLVLNDSVSAAKAKNVIEVLMPKTLLADGGTHYVGYQNESPSYHGEALIRMFAWYYIFTKSQPIKDFICATTKYIPLVYTPLGMGYHEWSTSPAWKPYYNQVTLKIEALAKAYLTGDQYNYTIGQGSQHLYLAFLYRSGLSGAALPGNRMLYDKNCMGPRGTFGNWGVVGTLRDPSNPLPELTEPQFLNMDGVNTIVGAFTLNTAAASNVYPLNAAFQGAAPQIKYASGDETDWARGVKWAFLTGKNRNDAQTKSKSVYGLTTNYGVSKIRFAEVGWKAQQQWVVTPDRVIGMTEMEASVQSTVFGLAQRIQLVSGRLNASGTKKTLVPIDANTYEYGDLRVKIIDKNYNGTVDAIYHGVMNTVGDDRSVMLNLNDASSQGDTQFTYSAGTRRYAFFEVTNKDRSYSTNATRLTLTSGLEGFEFTESSGRKIRIIHNVTSSSIALNTNSMSCPYGRLRMLKSWDETLNELTVSAGSGTIPYTSIPAYGHIVIINSGIAEDYIAGVNQYSDFFNASLSFPSNLKVDSTVGTTVNLSWRQVSGATSYILKRASVAGGPFSDVATLTTTQYADTGLASNATYYYVVVAKNTSVTSAASDLVVASTATTTTWNGSSWSNGVPTSAMEAIIEGNYSTAATPGNGTFTSKKLTINSGTLTVVTGTNLTVVNELINNVGPTAVIIENNANLIQINDVTNTGAITVKRNSNLLKRLDYTMWSSPTGTTQTLSDFSPLTSSGRFYEYDSGTNFYSVVPPSTTFIQAKGFLIRMPNENSTSGYNGGTAPIVYTGVFTGIPNNGTIRISGNPGRFLATGNPYPSAINADSFINSNLDSGGTGTLYFWRKTNNINQRTTPSTSYATYTKAGAVVSGSGSPNEGYTPTVNLAVGQGFITTVPSSGQLVFTNSMRSSSNTLQVLKSNQIEKSRVWINLLSGADLINQMMFAYIEKASNEVDVYDGKYIGDNPIALSSEINNEEYVIQARGLPFEDSDIINLNFKTNIEGEYTIAKDRADGLFARGQDVYLVDKSIGKVTNLQTDSYKFTTLVGTYNDRFQILFKTSNAKAVINEKAILVNKQNGILNINAGTIVIKNVKVFDMMGRLIVEQKELNTATTSIKNLGDIRQVLIIKITTSNDEIITKKLIN